MTLIKSQRWAGAVLDFALCDEECTPLCEWLAEREIPFIVCTGYEEVSAPCSSGIRLLKPITSEEVVDTMAALVAV
jgi:hypothetical protein